MKAQRKETYGKVIVPKVDHWKGNGRKLDLEEVSNLEHLYPELVQGGYAPTTVRTVIDAAVGVPVIPVKPTGIQVKPEEIKGYRYPAPTLKQERAMQGPDEFTAIIVGIILLMYLSFAASLLAPNKGYHRASDEMPNLKGEMIPQPPTMGRTGAR